MHTSSKVHASMGGDTRLLVSKSSATGVRLPSEPMVGVLFSQKSTLRGSTSPGTYEHAGQLGKNLLQEGKADQEDASHLGLAQLSSILLHPWYPISGDS